MAKIFPTTIKRVIIQQGGSGEEVTNEKLTYDLPETHPTSEDAASVVVSVDESSPAPMEEGILAVLLEAFESHPVSTDSATFEVEVLVESHATPTDAAEIVADVQEMHPVPSDEIVGVVMVMDEFSPTPVEDVTGTEARVVVDESHPVSVDASTAEADVQESHRVSDDAATVIAVVAETFPVPSESVNGTQADFTINESAPVSVDANSFVMQVLAETAPVSTHTDFTEVSGNLWPDTTGTTTGFTNAANAVDKNTGTAATCSASSSGLGNLTSNTTNGTLTIRAPDPQLSDMTAITSAVVRVSTDAANTGSLSGQAISMALAYSVNDGGAWTTFATISTFEGAQTRTVDITSTIANNWTNVNGFRLRATGSVTSGIGTAVIAGVSTFSYFYGRLELIASRTY